MCRFAPVAVRQIIQLPSVPSPHQPVHDGVGNVEVFVRHDSLIVVRGVQPCKPREAGNAVHPVVFFQVV